MKVVVVTYVFDEEDEDPRHFAEWLVEQTDDPAVENVSYEIHDWPLRSAS